MKLISIRVFLICVPLLAGISTAQATSILPGKPPSYAACYESAMSQKPIANQAANQSRVTKSGRMFSMAHPVYS